MTSPNKPPRWWLPGPPPTRRQLSLDTVDESYQRDGTPELSIPVRHLTVPFAERSSVLCPYLGRLDQPTTAPGESKETYLFHGCGNVTSPRVVQSFARWGPSIRFSKARSYFSTGRAVYWSNSIEFALAWCFFCETGSWDLAGFNGEHPLESLIFVSRPDLRDINLQVIPKPQTPEDEEELDNWCDTNMNRTRIPPPKLQQSDWGVLASRIPRRTVESVKMERQKTDNTWLYAALDEASSQAIAKAGVEASPEY
ncbi:hypothetical protein N0V84_012785 [Fusarium piperis]|uniref:Uncharacterized protein n=1 Tax=Fusarium piperis TaxID=1435070 RepID=A0A9W8TBE0_9HYPO|nr:hypothetical protein N0V84_012785 [Fusarium piperis]